MVHIPIDKDDLPELAQLTGKFRCLEVIRNIKVSINFKVILDIPISHYAWKYGMRHVSNYNKDIKQLLMPNTLRPAEVVNEIEGYLQSRI